MSEENADSVEVEVEEVTETNEVENDGFDMDGAVDQLGEDLFGKSENEEEPEPEEVETDKVEEPEEEVEEETEEVEEVAKLDRPDSWKKDMQEEWDAMSPKQQEYVVQREQQMKDGLELDRNDSNLGRTIRDTLKPYEQMLKQNNVDEQTAVRQLMHNHMQLATAPADQKKALFEQWARGYGVEFGQEGEVDPGIKALKDELSQLKGYINNIQQNEQTRSAQEKERVTSEIVDSVNDFAEKHPHFDELSDEIARLVGADYELEDAYNIAFKNSEHYAEQLRQESLEQALEKARKETEKVKQAKSVNVKNRDTGKTQTEKLGTMDDTMKAALREINSR